jgi:hypothetical protein
LLATSLPFSQSLAFSTFDVMPMNTSYAELEPSRDSIDRLTQPTLLEFGTSWCGY